MATTGEAAWEKYYRLKGDVNTFVKKDTEAFAERSPNAVAGKLTAGQEVTVLETKAFDKRPVVTYKFGGKTHRVRIKFDMLQKPGVKPRGFASDGKTPEGRTIPNKALTPDGLKLAGKTIQKAAFISEVVKAVSTNALVAPHVKEFMIEVLKNSTKDRSILPKAKLSKQDVKVIAKDFGEITGAWWFLNNYEQSGSPVVAIEFPSKSNQKLVDYYAILKNGLKISVSAKAGEGAAPSITSVWEMIKGKQFSDPSERTVYEFIEAIAENSGTEGIIIAAKTLKSKIYLLVGKIISENNYGEKHIEDWLTTFKDGDSVYSSLDEHFYSKIGKDAKLKTLNDMWNSSGRKSGAILSPMAYALVDEANENAKYTGFLTDVLRTTGIQQLYIDLSSTAVEYDLRAFAKSEFIFEYHSNAANPGGNKIGFKLKK